MVDPATVANDVTGALGLRVSWLVAVGDAVAIPAAIVDKVTEALETAATPPTAEVTVVEVPVVDVTELEERLRAESAPKSSSSSTKVVTASIVAGSMICNTEHKANFVVPTGAAGVSYQPASTLPGTVRPRARPLNPHLMAY